MVLHETTMFHYSKINGHKTEKADHKM
jgi:hypothetical protein